MFGDLDLFDMVIRIKPLPFCRSQQLFLEKYFFVGVLKVNDEKEACGSASGSGSIG
jgi:hypothetical protein